MKLVLQIINQNGLKKKMFFLFLCVCVCVGGWGGGGGYFPLKSVYKS